MSKIRSALFGSANGFLKANGSGAISAVSTVPVASGGTGASDAAAARANLGALSSSAGAVGETNLANDIPYTKFGLAADQVRHVYAGTTEPGADLGSDGDIYLMYAN